MIKWLTGNIGAGKTTLAKKMQINAINKTIILDGNELREVWKDLKFTRGNRWVHNLRVANLAVLIHSQGFDVIVAVICPFEKLREEVKQITGCKFIYLPYGKKSSEEFPYEIPLKYWDKYERKN